MKQLFCVLALFLVVLTVALPARAQDISSGLVVHLPLDESSGTNAPDASGNGNNGTLVNMDDTDWVTGKFGNGLNSDGSADDIHILTPSNLPASTVTVSAWVYVPAHASYHRFVTNGWSSTSNPENWMLFSTGSGNLIFGLWGAQTSGAQKNAQGCSGTFTTNTWHLATGTYDGTTVRSYLDGVLCATSSAAGITLRNTGTIVVNDDGNHYIDDVRIYNRALSATDIAALYNASPKACNAANEAMLLYNNERGVMEYCNGTQWVEAGSPQGLNPEPTDGLLVHLDFEDGSGTTATDIVGGNNGTLTNMDAATDWVAGKVGNYALDFDNTNDFVRIPDPIPDGQTNISVSLWAKANSWVTGSSWDTMLTQTQPTGTNTVFTLLQIGSSSRVGFVARNSSGDGVSATTPRPATGSWVHYVGTYDGSNVRLYLDGALVDTQPQTGALYNTSDIISIGRKWDSGVYPTGNHSLGFNGQIDDVRIYNRALTAEEVANLYNSGNGKVTCTYPDGTEGEIGYNYTVGTMQYCSRAGWTSLGPAIAGASPASNVPTSGLVGHWKLDETSGTTITDSTGTQNGTLGGGLTIATNATDGIQGGAISFDGIDDVINIAHNDNFRLSPSSGTVSIWVYPEAGNTSGGRAIGFGKGSWEGWALRYGGNFAISDSSGPDDPACTVGSLDTAIENWTLLTVVVDRDNSKYKCYRNGNLVATHTISETLSNTDILKIGGAPSNITGGFFKGKLDDARIYNRALSDAEVLALYQGTGGASTTPTEPTSGLVGHWEFEEGSGTNADDSSATDNDGTLNGMTDVNWVEGKVGDGAIDFDGASDSVTVANNAAYQFGTGNLSLAGWFKSEDAAQGVQMILDARDTTGGNNSGFFVGLSNAGRVSAYARDISGDGGDTVSVASPTDLRDNQWHHFVVSYDKTDELRIYIDGAEAAASDLTSIGNTDSNEGLTIGYKHLSGSGWSYFDGKLDDIRIYNRALSAAEVLDLYNATGTSQGLKTCTNPPGVEGEMVYNDDENTMQYCGPAGWVAVR